MAYMGEEMEYTEEQIKEMKNAIVEKYNQKESFTLEDFKMIMRILRNKEYGCPWDSVQTHESITQCLIEECYETIEAIKDRDNENLREELGDVLMQVVMHAEIASEEQLFCLEDVIEEISRKMVRRHPKVFGQTDSNASSWEQIKAEEKKDTKEAKKGELGRIASGLPALIRAQKAIKKSDKLYGDSPSVEESIEKLKNCVYLLEKSVILSENSSNIDKILGETLLEITNVAYRMEENAENSLTNAVEQFINKREGEKR